MIERDLNDSFPEAEFTTWSCPTCGLEQEIMASLQDSAECPACEDASMGVIDTDWFDLIDPVERDVA